MSRADGSAYPPLPSDADHRSVSGELRRESDELPDPSSYDQALWPLLAGDVAQPRCMCGVWASVGECETCQKELALYRRWDQEDEEYRRAYHSEMRDRAWVEQRARDLEQQRRER